MTRQKRNKLLGISLLVISAISSLAGLTIPFLRLDIAVTQKAYWVTGLLVTGEVLLALSVLVLGKQYGKQLKDRIMRFFERSSSGPEA